MNRRELLALAGATALTPRVSARNGFVACVHEATSTNFDYRTAMEGYSRAGIRAVEVMLTKAKEFADKNSVASARRLLDDLGLRPVSTSNQLGLVEPNPARAKNLEELRWKCELAQALGGDRIVAPTLTREAFTEDDYKRGVDNLREAGEIARPFKITLMVEFTRLSTFAGTLSTALQLVRGANHPSVRVMMDTYHFWGGVSKFEDLELLRDGELHHLHFEDVPASPPREQLEQRHRAWPGQGIAPLRRILEVLKRKKYAGPASVEMFDPMIQATDPYQVGLKVRAAVDALSG
jgi:sugar phosphate isomerase/epimerase